MISIFVWIATFIFSFLFLVWSRVGWPNFLIKTCLLFMFVFGVILLYKETGFTQLFFNLK